MTGLLQLDQALPHQLLLLLHLLGRRLSAGPAHGQPERLEPPLLVGLERRRENRCDGGLVALPL